MYDTDFFKFLFNFLTRIITWSFRTTFNYIWF